MNVLILTSSNRNFPIDIHQEITKAGQNAIRFTQLADFFSSPLRQRPYLAILEIGNPEDIQRGILAYEWTQGEEAPCRFLLLLSSKYLQLGEKALRFAGTETAVLPMAAKNLLFKIELQLKLLLSDKPKMPASTQVFRADVSTFERHRVLKLKGPNPFEGKWNKDLQNSPSGKIRWRWVRTHAPENTEQEKSIPSWTLESDTAPVYLPQEKIWQITDSSANLLGHFGEEEIYSWKSFLEKQGIFLDESSQSKGKPEKQEDNRNEKDSESFLPKLSVEEKRKNADSLEKPAGEPKLEKATLAENKESLQKHRPAEERKRKEEESRSEGAKHSPHADEDVQKPEQNLSNSTQEEIEKKKILSSQQEIIESSAKKKERAGSSLLAEDVSAPGEDLTEKNWSTQQDQALPGSLESHQKKAKFAIDDLTNSLKQKSQIETLNTEQNSPSQSVLTEEELLGKMKKKEFEIQEKQKRSVLQQQVEIEGSHRSDRRNEFIQEESLPNPKKAIQEEGKDNPSLEEIFSRPKKNPESLEKGTKEELLEPKLEKEIKRTPISEESFQSAAKSYSREKEISKKIVVDPQNQQEKEGKIEIEIPADPKLLEQEKRIAPSPALLELEQKFSKDNPTKSLESDFLKVRHFEILSLKDLDDENSSWHPVDQFRVYLKAKHRYYGVKDVREIFPLWIYSGELAPEFLEKEESWKFYDRPPKKYLLQDALPVAVARFIQKLAQLSGEEQIGITDREPANPGTQRTEKKPDEKAAPGRAEVEESPSQKSPQKRGVLGFFQSLFQKK